MKKSLMLASVLLFASWTAAEESPRTFIGEIGDSQCALNVHSLTRSHREMLKSKSMGGTATDCANYCTKYLGGHFVLVVKDNVYHLDDQQRAQPFSGRQVRLTGKLDAKSSTIHVVDIEPK